MRTGWGWAGMAAAALLAATGSLARAHDGPPRYPVGFDCENGHSYRIQPLAVSDMGEIVTAHLVTGRQRIHVRLVPMGDGYRYAGRGIWIDGTLDEAVLNFGTPRAVPCAVIYN